ncbi:MAG TPA: hypothetical protein HA250_00945 [Nanoarchaeota archaeon]|nr:MAG: hypothetical protein QT01_C0002G0085 [archaeon GW2011_AR6]MBS3082677.1 hypothetical protein [Candidatus Pacearchaeota archaeon]HIH18221.1 hypothetical protein [Nanoarchaeota archaeon]HIH34336.1 hypothetical protein [Nanoarchaeota archaeon]HIH50907.1 hypothetical protein [Nanoarchaeota archaeon]
MEQKKEEKRNPWSLFGAAVVAVMFLGSTIGLVFFYSGDSSNQGDLGKPTYDYNGFKFVQGDGGWQTSTAFGPLIMVNLPQQVKDLECVGCELLDYNSLAGGKVYIISSSAAEDNGAAEILRNFPYSSKQRACLPENGEKEECKELPLRDCADASLESKIVILEEGVIQGENEEEGVSKASREKVNYRNSCLTLEGENLIKAADRAIYKAFGVIS